jgi:hypothetical protein
MPNAASGANTEMPMNYTSDDFVLIMLRERRAPTISILITRTNESGAARAGP